VVPRPISAQALTALPDIYKVFLIQISLSSNNRQNAKAVAKQFAAAFVFKMIT
jgi:hypothetical protein